MLTFGVWKELLYNDCVALGKEREYDALGEPVLKMLYDSGLDPTVKAISEGMDEQGTDEKEVA